MNNRDGTFSDVSGIAGLDFLEDSRTFALGDFDQDGRLEVVFKESQQTVRILRYLKNVLPELPPVTLFSPFREGEQSRRHRSQDHGGDRIWPPEPHPPNWFRVPSRNTRKRCFVGWEPAKSPVQATIQWPSGLSQKLHDLPINHRIWGGRRAAAIAKWSLFAKSSELAGDSNSPLHTNETLPQSCGNLAACAGSLATDFFLFLILPEQVRNLLCPIAASRCFSIFLVRIPARFPEDLEEFELSHEGWARKGLQLLTINVDGAQNEGESHAQLSLALNSFPILKSFSRLPSPRIASCYRQFVRSPVRPQRSAFIPCRSGRIQSSRFTVAQC